MKQESKGRIYREKMTDYKRFAYSLLCISVFTYFGTLIGMHEGREHYAFLPVATLILLIGSSVFFTLSLSYKKKYHQEDDPFTS
ncbi:YrhC family protein [Bacillus testis]|uniref:YrhC family protein n=1 Tax=Bacillus testis TaxID=1622072 RepID=UPI00067F3898|nr:YrhC family protein [Bacillus testis]